MEALTHGLEFAAGCVAGLIILEAFTPIKPIELLRKYLER